MRNAYILFAAILVERLSFYLIIPRSWTLVSGLLYLRLGIRYAQRYPHIGTSFFAGGGLMMAYFVSEIFAIVGLFVVTVALMLLALKLPRRLDGLRLAIGKILGLFFFWAYLIALVGVYLNRDVL